MSTGKIYLIERNRRKQALSDRDFDETLIYNFLESSPEKQLEYKKQYQLRKQLNEAICENHTWEETLYGYELRTDYNYSEEEQDLTFKKHIIFVRGINFGTNGTDIAEAHLRKHQQELALLPDIDKLTEQYKIAFFDQYDPEWKRREVERKITNSQYHLLSRISYEQRELANYIYLFGNTGKVLLVKWLNRLTDPNATLEELLEELINDINIAKERFALEEDPEKTEYYQEYAGYLLKLLEIHSPKGKYLSKAYYKAKNKEGLSL